MGLRDSLNSVFKSKDQFELTSGGIGRPLFYLSIPIVVTSLLQTAYNVADTFWLGRHSEDALAAISFAFPMVFLLISMGMGLAIAGSVLVAQNTGAGNTEQAEYAASQVTVFSLMVSVILGGASYFLVDDFLAITGASNTIVTLGSSYMQVISLGLVFMFGFFTFVFLMRGYGDTITPMIVTFGSVAINVVIDPFLIFGWGPLPGLGIQGAAVATVFSRSLALAVALYIMVATEYGVQVHPSSMIPDLGYARKILRIGAPASIEMTGRALIINLLLFIVGMFSDPVAAAFGIGSRIFSVVFLPAAAVSRGVETMTGQNVGAGEFDRVEKTNRLAAIVMFVALTLMGAVTFAFAAPIVGLFTNDPVIIREGEKFLHYIAPSFGFLGVMRAYIGGLRGTGKTTVAAVIGVSIVGAVRLILGYFTAVELGIIGLWISFSVSNVVGAAVAYLWFRRGSWREMDLVESEGSVAETTD
ncbi:MAG: MATE family efflux transporter [Halobacteria archaeon]